jgi:hypothetical protein
MDIYIYTICTISTYIGLTEDFDNEYLEVMRGRTEVRAEELHNKDMRRMTWEVNVAYMRKVINHPNISHENLHTEVGTPRPVMYDNIKMNCKI